MQYFCGMTPGLHFPLCITNKGKIRGGAAAEIEFDRNTKISSQFVSLGCQDSSKESKEPENIYVALARAAIEEWLRHEQQLDWDIYQTLILQGELVETLEAQALGVFVSLYHQGSLRGSIGTVEPVKKNLAEEIIHNAILAATKDPRFHPIEKEILHELKISVDIIGTPEIVQDEGSLDDKAYHGLIIEAGGQKSLIIPRLVEDNDIKKEIADARATIKNEADAISIYRFDIARY